MLIDTLFGLWQQAAEIEKHARGLSPGEVERLEAVLADLVRVPARARSKLVEASDEDCAELSWLLLARIGGEKLAAEVALSVVDWAELTLEFSGLEHSQGSVLSGHVKLCRGWALASTNGDEARLAFEQAEAEYRDAQARPALLGLALCCQGAVDLREGNLGSGGEDEGALERFETGRDRIRSDAQAGDVAAAVQAAFDRAFEQWRWADALTTAAEPERVTPEPGTLLDLQLLDFFKARVVSAVVRNERRPVELLWLGEVAEALAERLGRPRDFIPSMVGFFFQVRRLDQAEELLRTRLAKHPDDREAIHAFASALLLQEKLDAAEDFLRKTLERVTDDADLHANLAMILLKKDDLSGAAEQIHCALALDPENAGAKLIERTLPKASIAVQDDTIYIGGDMENLPLKELGAALMAAVLVSQTREDIQKALAELTESDAAMAARVTEILQSKGVLEPPEEAASVRHLRRAEELFGATKFEAAIEEYDAAIRDDPDLAYAYMGLGDSYYRTGRYYQAIVFFQESLALKPAASTYRFMGDSYRHVDKLASAREAYEKALELDPGYATARESLQSLRTEMGDPESAAARRRPAAEAGTPRGLPPVPQWLDASPYHLFNLADYEFPDLEDLAREEQKNQEGADALAGGDPPAPETPLAPTLPPEPSSGGGPEGETGRPERELRARLSADELIESIENKSFPGLRALLALESLDEQLGWIREVYPPQACRSLVMILRAPLFFLHEREKRLDEALRLAMLLHGVAQLLPSDWPPDQDLSPARLRSDAAESLAAVHLDRGELAQSLEYLLEAVRWYEEDQKERSRRGLGTSQFDRLMAGGADPGVRLFHRLAGIYFDLGDEEKGREYARRAMAGGEALLSPEQRFNDLVERASHIEELGDYDHALMLFDKAVPLAIESRENLIVPRRLTLLLYHTGRLLARLRLFHMALRYLGRALEINTSVQTQSRLLTNLLAQAEIFEQRPDLGDAVTSYEAALRCVSVADRGGSRYVWRDASGATYQVIDPEDAWKALLPLAKLLESRGHLEQASGFLVLAVELGEQTRFQVSHPDHRIGVQAHHVGAYESLARIEIRRAGEHPDRAEEHLRRAWSVVEQSRGRAFAELLGGSRLGLSGGAPADLVERETTLRRRLDESSQQESGAGAWEAYEAVYEELETVWQDLAAISPEAADYVELRRGRPIQFEEARRLLYEGFA